MSTVPYRLLDGTIVATDWTALITGVLAAGIDRDEFAASKPGKEVWTATKADGTLSADGCNGFTSTDAGATSAFVGLTGKVDGTWTNAYLQFCDRANVRLYCIEQ